MFIIAAMTSVTGLQQPQRRTGIRARSLIALAVLAGSIALATAVRAVEDVTLHVEHVAGEGWTANDVAIDLALPGAAALVRARIGRLHVSALSKTITDVRVECPALDLRNDVISCTEARVLANWPALGKQSLDATLIYGRADGSLDVTLRGLRVGEGRVALQASLREAGWNAKARLQRVPIERLMKLAGELEAPLPSSTATGLVDLTLTARGSQSNLREANFDGSLMEVTANNESGSLASDKLSLQVQGNVQGSAQRWQFDVAVQSSQGQAFAQPVFLDLSAHAMSFRAQGEFTPGTSLTLDRFTLDHSEVVQASGRGRLQFDHEQPLRDLELELATLQFPGAYESYLQPLLIDTHLETVQTAGSIGGKLSVADGEPRRIELRLDDVTVDDGEGKLNLSRLSGHWHWLPEAASESSTDDDAPPARDLQVAPSQVKWHSGSVLGLALGPSELSFTTHGRQFRLVQPARIPLLDGSIDVETFRVRNAGLPAVAFLVDATLQPISVRQLCKAFGWPEFGGRVGGVISKLRMREGIITLGTKLRAQVFDGEVTLSDLRLEQPFGPWPRFYSSIALDHLDLEPMTSAFSFGRITGRLSGAIDGLQLFNWTPVAFDARLYTPEDDRSRHRISQRAVENIGSIGGGGAGVTAALSSGFLRFFDDFNYDRLGISCRLHNEVCIMDGVAPAANGNYYLVKGKGLPRIDVIGSSRRVDWPRLVQQLLAATESGGPVLR